ncbi:MAG: extracellular solute-binding protein [Erysipelothrix sp.]|nr:extracellular solute-binding protein [Erysipelothrix sp.]
MKRLFTSLMVLLLVGAVLAACGPKTPPSNGDDGKLGGELVVYSPNSDGEVEGLLYYWAEKNDVKVNLQSMGTGEALTKIAAEKDNPQADLMFGGMNLGAYLQHEGLFEEYVATGYDKIPAGYRTHLEKYPFFTHYGLSGSNLLVNVNLEAELIESGDLKGEIKGYADLLQPGLKGKIAMGDAGGSSSALAQLTNMLLVMNPDAKKDGLDGELAYGPDAKGWDYVEEFMANLDGKILGSSSALYKGTEAGEYVVAATYEDPSIALLTDGSKNVRVVYPEEGAVWLPAASAIVKGAKNLENAKSFIDFLVSDEGQKQIAKLTYRPVRDDIIHENEYMQPFSDINVAFEDIEYVSNHRSEIQAQFKDILTNLGIATD